MGFQINFMSIFTYLIWWIWVKYYKIEKIYINIQKKNLDISKSCLNLLYTIIVFS